MKKTIGELIDELSITNCKIFSLMEVGNDLEKVKKLNGYRSELKGAINEYFGERIEIKV
jgi:hypothetical protein